MSDIEKSNFRTTQKQGWLWIGNIRISRFTLGIFVLLTLAATLTAGLWPFSVPRNDVTWANSENAIVFGTHGSAFSRTMPKFAGLDSEAFTLELWVRPADVWATGTIFASYDPNAKRQFAVMQDDRALVLRLAGEMIDPGVARELRLEDVFREQAMFLTVASDGRNVSVFVDGHRILQATDLPLSIKDLSGQMILGGAALRDRSWSGRIKGLAIYGRELNQQTILQHARNWTQEGDPGSGSSEHLLALYLFRERSGDVIHSAVSSGVDLDIPMRFKVIDHLRFETPVSESKAGANYLKNALVNVIGFVPLGFLTALFAAAFWKPRRATVIAILLGAATSLTIEYFQSFLPTRYSGTTDLVTNTIGSWMGAVLYFATARFLPNTFRLSPSRSRSE